jgi:hypothetical protein
MPIIYYLSQFQSQQMITEFQSNTYLQVLFFGNVGLMINRVSWRMFSAFRIYGFGAMLMAPIRIPLSNLINALACIHAVKNYFAAKYFNSKLTWGKTSHKLPEGFGQQTIEETIN